MSLRDISIGILINIVSGLIVTLVVMPKLETYRERLRRSRRGWARRRYVKALVDAVRGEAHVFDTVAIAYILMFSLMALVSLNTFWTSVQTREVNHLVTILTALEDSDSRGRVPPQNGDASTVEAQTEVPDTALKAQMSIQEDDDLTRAVGALNVFDATMGYFYRLSLVLMSIAIWLWTPFLVIRKQLSIDLQRAILRIQSLATKEQLARLAELESRVTNENTLRAFIYHIHHIAEQHNVAQLVARFNLWGDELLQGTPSEASQKS